MGLPQGCKVTVSGCCEHLDWSPALLTSSGGTKQQLQALVLTPILLLSHHPHCQPVSAI